MTGDFGKVLACGVCAIVLAAAPAAAATDIGDWETDGEAGLTAEEFDAGWEEAGVFQDWDEDDDDRLTAEEFDAGLGDNRDGFTERFGDDLYDEWDADGDELISENELREGTFGAYDPDKDRVIEEPELGDLGDDMGDGGFWDI